MFLLVNFKAFIETVKVYFVKIIFCIWPLWIGFCVGFYGLLKLKNIFKNFWRFEDSFMKGRVSWLSNILVATRNILYTCSPCGSVLLARILVSEIMSEIFDVQALSKGGRTRENLLTSSKEN